MGIFVPLRPSCHQEDSRLVCFRWSWKTPSGVERLCGTLWVWCWFLRLSSFPELRRFNCGMLRPALSCCVNIQPGYLCLLRSERLVPSTYPQIQSDSHFSPSSGLTYWDTSFQVLPFVILRQKRRSTKGTLADVWWRNRKSMSQLRQAWRTVVSWVGGLYIGCFLMHRKSLIHIFDLVSWCITRHLQVGGIGDQCLHSAAAVAAPVFSA